MTKLELMKVVLTEEEMGYCDTAIPQALWPSCDTSLSVYDCRNNKVINLAEEFFRRGHAEMQRIKLSNAEYDAKKLRLQLKKLGVEESNEIIFEDDDEGNNNSDNNKKD